jgi:ornithine cyclodeaminase/alanine dehydrogenase-like protein (mu-crystallin family)
MGGKKVDFLYLSEPDMIEAGVLNMKKCVEVIDETFKLIGKDDYLMGGPRENEHGMMLWFPKEQRNPNMPVAGPDRRFMSMIAYLGGEFNVCGSKWYGSNIENPKGGLPRSILTVTLNDPITSEPLAFMSGNLISAMRTGAVPGVAAKYLAKQNSEVVGIVGCGVINKACLMSIAETQKNIKAVKVYDIFKDKAEAFSQEMSEKLGLDVHPVNSLEEAIVDSDILSVAASGHRKVAIKPEWLKEGSLLTLTGTAELPDDFYMGNKIVADNWKMHQAWLTEATEHPDGIESITSWAPTGQLLKLVMEGKVNEEKIESLGEIALSESPRRRDSKERIIFVTGGLPVEDVAWGYAIYQEALKRGIGQKLNLWDEPHWF